MMAFFLSALCFLLIIPLKAIVMGYELKHKKSKVLVEKMDPLKVSGLMSRIGIKNNDKKDDSSDTDPKRKAVKVFQEVVIATLKTLIVFLKALASVIASCGFLSILITLVVFVVVVVSIGGVFGLLEPNGFLGANPDENRQTANSTVNTQQESNQLATEYVGTGQTQVFTDNSNWVACCKTVFDWYFANIHTYQANSYIDPTTGKKVHKRRYYNCDLFPGTSGVGDDCSAYVSAVLVYAGFLPTSALTNYGSSAYWGNGIAVPTMRKYFNQYTYADFVNGNYIPRAGDIIAQDGHIEIIASVEPLKAYSWGSVPKSNPCNRSYKTLSKYMTQGSSDTDGDVKCIWALKDNVVPNSYLEGKEIKDIEEE